MVNLHRTARILVEEFGGEVTSDPEVLVKLPRIGPYKAGAVSCFAFEKDTDYLTTVSVSVGGEFVIDGVLNTTRACNTEL